MKIMTKRPMLWANIVLVFIILVVILVPIAKTEGWIQ